MTQGEFVRRRNEDWNRLERAISVRKPSFKTEAKDFPYLYRKVVQDLTTARSENYDPSLVNRLDRLVLLGHQKLYSDRRLSVRGVTDTLAFGFPQAVRRERKLVYLFTAVFIVVAVIGFFAVGSDEQTMAQVYSYSTVEDLAQMYKPDSEHFLRPRGVGGDADMFGFYIYNNISIAFRTFAGGILAGFGSILFFLYNAVFLGASAGFLVSIGSGSTFFPFVVGHGAVEVCGLLLSAVAGFRLGISLAFPPPRLSRKQALAKTGREVLPLTGGIVMLLVFAAIIEAFWSSQPMPVAAKYIAGGCVFVLLSLYLWLGGRNHVR